MTRRKSEKETGMKTRKSGQVACKGSGSVVKAAVYEVEAIWGEKSEKQVSEKARALQWGARHNYRLSEISEVKRFVVDNLTRWLMGEKATPCSYNRAKAYIFIRKGTRLVKAARNTMDRERRGFCRSAL
jgi:hypothetical protein